MLSYYYYYYYFIIILYIPSLIRSVMTLTLYFFFSFESLTHITIIYSFFFWNFYYFPTIFFMKFSIFNLAFLRTIFDFLQREHVLKALSCATLWHVWHIFSLFFSIKRRNQSLFVTVSIAGVTHGNRSHSKAKRQPYSLNKSSYILFTVETPN